MHVDSVFLIDITPSYDVFNDTEDKIKQNIIIEQNKQSVNRISNHSFNLT